MRLRLLLPFPLLLAAAHAHADPQPQVRFRLHYEWPRGVDCPVEYSVRLQIGAVLGYDPFQPAGDHHIVLLVTEEEDHFRARLTLWTPGWSQIWRDELTDRYCDELLRTVATSVGFGMLRLMSPHTEPTPSDPPATPPPTPALPAPVVDAPKPKKEPPAPSWSVSPELWVGLSLSGFRTPSILGGFLVAGGVRIKDASIAVEAHGAVAFKDDEIYQPGKVYHFQSSFASVSFVPCYRPALWRQYGIHFLLCGAIELGYRRFTSREGNFDEMNDLAVGVGGRLGLDWMVMKHLFVRGYGEALLNATRHHLGLPGQPSWAAGGIPLASGIGVGVVW